jgi:hypothetical protein
MWQTIYRCVIVCGVLLITAPPAPAANSDPTQVKKAVQAYIGEVNQQAAQNRESVEENQTITADLNGDGNAEIILWSTRYGGTYFHNNVTVFTDTGRGYQMAAETADALGSVESIEVKNGLIHINALWPGPNDPRCCPTVKKTAVYQWQSKALVDVTGRAAGTPAPAQPPADGNWEFQQIRGKKLAIIKNAGAGLKVLALTCEQHIPVLTTAFNAPQRKPLLLDIIIAGQSYPFNLLLPPTGGELWFGDLNRSRLPLALLDNYAQAEVKINGVSYGPLSLRNANIAGKEALSDCYRY